MPLNQYSVIIEAYTDFGPSAEMMVTVDVLQGVPPSLSDLLATPTVFDRVDVSFTTSEGNGRAYVVVTPSATPPSALQIRQGQDHTGAATPNANVAVSAAGTVEVEVAGLSENKPYWAYVVHRDNGGHDSNVVVDDFVTPLSGPIMTLDFTSASYVGASPTISRASSGTALTTAGSVVKFGANTLRRTDRGLLVEPAAVNRVTLSENLSSSFPALNMVWTSDALAAPDGTMTADLLTIANTGGSGTARASRATTLTAPSTPHLVSFFAKSNDVLSTIGVATALYDAAANSSTIFTLTGAGSVTKGANHLGAGIVALANGWYWIWISFQSVTDLAGEIRLQWSGSSLTFDGSRSIYIWGADFKVENALSSYMPTSGAMATREADQVSVTIPAGVNEITYEFSDGSTHVATVSPGPYTIPTSLPAGRYIETIISN